MKHHQDIENNIEATIRRLPHFSGKHAEQGIGSYGPFGFLNPTGRRSVFSLSPGLGGGLKKGQEGQNHERDESEEEVKNGTANGDGNVAEEKKGKKEEEIRAEDVQRLYRTRDNRKGNPSLPSLLRTCSYSKRLNRC